MRESSGLRARTPWHMSSIDAYNSLMTTFTSLEGNLTIHNASISAENAKVAACDRICAPAADEGVRRMLCRCASFVGECCPHGVLWLTPRAFQNLVQLKEAYDEAHSAWLEAESQFRSEEAAAKSAADAAVYAKGEYDKYASAKSAGQVALTPHLLSSLFSARCAARSLAMVVPLFLVPCPTSVWVEDTHRRVTPRRKLEMDEWERVWDQGGRPLAGLSCLAREHTRTCTHAQSHTCIRMSRRSMTRRSRR